MIAIVSGVIEMCSGDRERYPTQLGNNQGRLPGESVVSELICKNEKELTRQSRGRKQFE